MVTTSYGTSSSDGGDHSNMAEKVFLIPEVLENILLMLDDRHPDDDESFNTAIKDLFIVQRVNKTFKAAIDGSIKLQRVMLLAHDSRDAPEREYGLEFFLNGPLGNYNFHPAIPCSREFESTDDERTICFYMKHYIVGAGKEDEDEGCVGCDCIDSDTDPESLHNSMRALTRAALKHHLCREASWRRMKLACQPQKITMRLIIWTWTHDRYTGVYAHAAILSPTETLGALYDSLQQVMCRKETDQDREQARLARIAREFLNARDGPKDETRARQDRQLRSQPRRLQLVQCRRSGRRFR